MQIINRCIFFLSLILLLGSPAIAVQKGIVNVPEADVYQDENFDSEVIDNLKSGETYQVSDKVYGQFYKIKLKSGKIGYIADYELKINGKEFQDEPFKEGLEEIKPPLKKSPLRKKSKAKAQADPQFDEDSEDESFFKEHFSGVTLQLINLHEETMGSVQVDNLYAIGFKSMDLTSIWEVFATLNAPKYYAEKTKSGAEGFQIWGTRGFNAQIFISPLNRFRYGGSFMIHLSRTKVTTATKSYDLQDITAGVIIDGGYLLQFKKVAFELTGKYVFDRNNYGGLGLSLLF